MHVDIWQNQYNIVKLKKKKKKAKHKASEKQSGDFGSVISMRKYKLEAQVQLGEMSITHSQLEAPPLSDHTSALGANDRGAETDQN